MTEQQQGTSIGHLPTHGKRWEFDRGVTNVFDDMIARSIPQYSAMRDLVTSLGARFVGAPGAGVVLDLGCSTGISIKEFAGTAARVVGVEISESMLEAARQRFASYSNVEILELDLRREYPDVAGVDLALAIFTLQFIPVEHRRRVVAKTYEALKPGGAFILAEKTIAETNVVQELLTERYHEFKVAQGYSREEVDRKALALEGSLVAQTADENETMLRRAGFRTVEPVWRWACFAAWIAVK